MKIGIYQGVDSLVKSLIHTNTQNGLNNLLAESFPKLFTTSQSFLQHLFTIPLPIRDKFVFFVLFGKENSGIPILDKEIILAFGMLDCSKLTLYNSDTVIPTLKNICRKKGMEWKGVGKHIMKSLEKYCITTNIKSVGLTAEHDNLINYYKRFGFILREDVHKNYMIKTIS
jgi:GNAT superfamily N-acetyltransferase